MNDLPIEIHYNIMTHLDVSSIKKLSTALLLPIPKEHDSFWKLKFQKSQYWLKTSSLPSESYCKAIFNFDKYGCIIYEFKLTLLSLCQLNKQQLDLLQWNQTNGPFFMIYLLSPDKKKTIAFNVMMYETLYSVFARLYKEHPDWFDFDKNVYVLHKSTHHKLFHTENEFSACLLQLSIVKNEKYEIGSFPLREDFVPIQKSKILTLLSSQ